MNYTIDIKGFFASIITTSDYVEYRLKHKGQNIEVYIPYEEISNDVIRERNNSYWESFVFAGAIGIVVFIALSIYQPFFFSMALLSFASVFKGVIAKKNELNYVSIPTDKSGIVLIESDETEAIIAELKEIRKSYLREKYFKINWDNEFTVELNKMSWLKMNNVITEKEFDEMKSQISTK